MERCKLVPLYKVLKILKDSGIEYIDGIHVSKMSQEDICSAINNYGFKKHDIKLISGGKATTLEGIIDELVEPTEIVRFNLTLNDIDTYFKFWKNNPCKERYYNNCDLHISKLGWRILSEELIDQILKTVPTNLTIVDYGCGTAFLSGVLKLYGRNVVSIDNMSEIKNTYIYNDIVTVSGNNVDEIDHYLNDQHALLISWGRNVKEIYEVMYRYMDNGGNYIILIGYPYHQYPTDSYTFPPNFLKNKIYGRRTEKDGKVIYEKLRNPFCLQLQSYSPNSGRNGSLTEICIYVRKEHVKQPCKKYDRSY